MGVWGLGWRLYGYVAMAIAFASLAAMCLIWMPIAVVLEALLPRAVAQPVGRRVIFVSFRAYLIILTVLCACRFDLRELDALRREPRLIVAANHPSLLDAVLIVSCLPNAVCVMKASLMSNPLLGAAARLAGYLRNGDAYRLTKQSRSSLADGAQLVLFPEGSRTRNYPLDPFNPVLGLIAKRSQTPVQMVLLEFSSPYLGKSWPWWKPPNLPLRCKARLGHRLDPCGDYVAFTSDIERRFRVALNGRAQ